MANNRSQELLKFAHLQMAAEAFLLGFNPNTLRADLVDALRVGNRRASVFPLALAEQFADQWVVVAHQENTPSGFSGTLFRSRLADPETGKFEYTLSLRSTEFVDDAIRDAKGAGNLEIRQLGWALGQMSDMEAFYARLKDEGKLPADAPFNVTGYSLGGHLALAFALMRREEGKEGLLKHVYTFNGAGTGDKNRGVEVNNLVKNFERLRDLIEKGADGALASFTDARDAQRRRQEVFAELQRLDAFADMTFPAKVVSVGTIGQQRDRNSGIKTFEVILDIVGSDPALKPGMTTSNEIVMETIPQAVFIPLESVFEKNGKLVVYKMNGGSPEATEVQIGAKNSNFVVIANGLNADRIPTAQGGRRWYPATVRYTLSRAR